MFRFRFHSPGRSALALAPGLAAVAIAGCGGGDGASRPYPVSGRVTCKGHLLALGTVTFSPETGGARVATGNIGPDGSYRLTTNIPSDGAQPGKYRVTITAEEIDLSKLQGAAKPGAALTPEQARSTPRRSLIPTKYALPEESGLSAVVEARTNIANFDLP